VYEPPVAPDMRINTVDYSVQDAVNDILLGLDRYLAP
jgi:adenylylsulfate kinase-like enzyme